MPATYIRNPEQLEAVVIIGTTPESLFLDFKRTIQGWDPPARIPNRDRLKAEAQRETCRDIAQFANTEGGCLLIGVAERLEPVARLKVADAIESVTDPDSMREWIEQAIRNYLVPATFRREIAVINNARGTVLAVNVNPSLNLVALWHSERRDQSEEKHSIEYLYRDSHGKKWMNPDEVERHIMNGSRAAKLAFQNVIALATGTEVRVAGGYWQRVGNPPNTTLQPWYPDGPVTLDSVSDQWFELGFRYGLTTLTLNLPFGVVQETWVGADGRVHLLLSVRVVHHYAGREIAVEGYD